MLNIKFGPQISELEFLFYNLLRCIEVEIA